MLLYVLHIPSLTLILTWSSTGGDSFVNGLGQPLDAGRACYMTCSGNGGEHCGGTWAMNVFKFTPTSSKRSKHFGRVRHQMRSHAF